MKEWKVAVVGCGSFADWQYFPNVFKTPGACCVAACDIIQERAIAASKKYNIPEWYPNVDELIAKCDFDIAIDAASIQAHEELNMKLLNAGKHVISQKPAALTVEAMTQQIEAAEKNGVLLSSVPIHVMRPDIRMAKQIIKEGAIGKPLTIKCVSAHGGPEYFQYRDADPSWFYEPGAGALYDMGVHALHQVTGIMGAAKSVFCMATCGRPLRMIRSGTFDGKMIKSDMLPDSYYICLNFGNEQMGFVDTGFTQPATRSVPLEIFGEKGVISFDAPGNTWPNPKLYLDRPELGVRGWMEPKDWVRPHPTDFNQCCCLDDMIDALNHGGKPHLSPQHARHVIEIMNSIPESIKTGQTIELKTTFEEVPW